ncbi:hypothetical protein C7972_12238 [Arenibacter sp. ARW7G5Y1]|nr:hypothetical protein C7972_12238 [Arenibacter sp. ARW7G5Y1]
MFMVREKISQTVFSVSAFPHSGGCKRKLEHEDGHNSPEGIRRIVRFGVEELIDFCQCNNK